jgi:hypothetical protein
MSERGKEAARRARREQALAARPGMTPSEPAPDRLRVATWNVNSLRVRLPALLRLLDRTRPDVVCLQETRGAQPSDDALAQLAGLGYEIAHVGTGGYNGVAILSRHGLRDVRGSGGFGDDVLDREPRGSSRSPSTCRRRRTSSRCTFLTGAPSTTGTSRTSSTSSPH